MKKFFKKYLGIIIGSIGLFGLLSLVITPSLIGTTYSKVVVDYAAWVIAMSITLMVMCICLKIFLIGIKKINKITKDENTQNN